MNTNKLQDLWRECNSGVKRYTAYRVRGTHQWQARCDFALVPEAFVKYAAVEIPHGDGFVNAEGTRSNGPELTGSDHVPVLLRLECKSDSTAEIVD